MSDVADTSSGQDRMFDLNRPQGYGKDDYLNQWRIASNTVFQLISNNHNNKNTRDIQLAVMFAISLIAHDDLRRQQEILYHSAIDYINGINVIPQEKMINLLKEICEDTTLSSEKKAEKIIRLFNNKSMTADVKVDEIMRVSAITMGNLTSYVDQFRGLAHTLKVGELVNQNKAYAKRTKAFGNPDEVIEL